MKRNWMVGVAALVATAGTASATPLRMDYCVTDLGGGQFSYVFTLTLDNNDGTWASGQGFGWIIFGDAVYPGPSPINDFVGDPNSLPAGPFTQFQGSGGGHNGPTLGPVVQGPPNYPDNDWIPTAIGQSISWAGTAAENLTQGEMLWSNLMNDGGATAANFVVANLLASCGTQSSCYANCDHSTVQPCLNVLDFTCFLNEFAAGNTAANCDNSTTPPVLNVLDFTCFLNKFASGCSSC